MSSYSPGEIEKILERYGDTIYRMAYLQVKSRNEADDIYQEVCLKLLRQESKIDDDGHLKAWLLRTTVNCCKDYWKSAWYRKVTFDNEPVMERQDVSEENETGYVTECMQGLSEKYRVILHLYYYEEYSIKEIGRILRLKENTVASRLSRGRSKLKKIIEKGGKNYGVYEF